MNDIEGIVEFTANFPIRLCPAHLQAAHLAGINLISSLCNIDDVKDLIEILQDKNPEIGDGEEAADDLYRLCIRVRNQYYGQFRY